MFYSHTFLARKGPLGTVWFAAHLEGRLKKSHCTSTDIPSTVERIMFPEFPIALRMSSYLLLGVVRIYSRKVEYLYNDCNVILVRLKNAFVSSDVNLPENATQAQFHAVTLPETFELDALVLDDYSSIDGPQDTHHISQQEITIIDQIPTEIEPYIAISFDDDIMQDVSHPEAFPHVGNKVMQEDNLPRGKDSIQQVNLPPFPDVDGIEHDGSEIEVQRDADQNYYSPKLPSWVDHANPAAESDRYSEQVLAEKEAHTPLLEDVQHPEPASSAAKDVPEIYNSRISLGNDTPELAPQSIPPLLLNVTPGFEVLQTPSVQPAAPDVVPRARRRKRKQFFDESTVLTNQFMKKALEDCSDLVNKRRKLPCSALDLWRFNNIRRKEKMLQEPLISGLCTDLLNVLERDFISSKPHLLSSEDAQQEHTAVQSCVPPRDHDIEYEQLLDDGVGPNLLADLMPHAHTPPQSHGNEQTSFPADNISSVSEAFSLPTADFGLSTGPFGSEPETPVIDLEGRHPLENTGLSDIPEFVNSAVADELDFLEADNNTPADSQGIQDNEMSARTRAVAHYLKRLSPLSLSADGLSGDLSLNSILQGRSKKLCALMLFETLVLKSYGLIDLQQDEPYGVSSSIFGCFRPSQVSSADHDHPHGHHHSRHGGSSSMKPAESSKAEMTEEKGKSEVQRSSAPTPVSYFPFNSHFSRL
ncbi:hypothetical protein Nepgr_006288 [Nepenthes gracilis]|uniref:Uncharacterized protein n=1 Tax=Nepenthes gracilis TaxID=150966 RepID=A0AAD3S555_NEPGR|nr:hypothetical protein Nepgr_006288 [Nepenthes gracilis]